MGKRTIGAMAAICLVLSGVSCSSSVVIDNYTVSSDHDIMQAFAGKGGDVYVTVRSKDPEVEGYSTLRIGESGEPIWRFKSSTIPEFQNGVFCSQYKDVVELFDSVTGKFLSKIDGILIEKEFDGKSLLFQTKGKNVKLIKTDLQGKVLWEVGLGDVETRNMALVNGKLSMNCIFSLGESHGIYGSFMISDEMENVQPNDIEETYSCYGFAEDEKKVHIIGTVDQIDFDTGKVSKTYPIYSDNEFSVYISGNNLKEFIFVDGNLTLLDMKTIEVLWKMPIKQNFTLKMDNNAAYLAIDSDIDGFDTIQMFNMRGGDLLWSYRLPMGSQVSTNVFTDYSIVEMHVNPLPVKVMAFNNADGRILWEKPLSITSSYRSSGSNLMTSKLQKAEKDYLVLSDFGSKQEKILLVDPRSGKEEFSFFLPEKDKDIKNICVSDGKVCVVYYNGAVLYNLKSGFKVAQVKYLEGTTSAGVTNLFAEFGPYVKNGLIIIKSPDGLVAYDMMTLRQLLDTVGTGLRRYVFGENSLILWSYGAVKTASLAR